MHFFNLDSLKPSSFPIYFKNHKFYRLGAVTIAVTVFGLITTFIFFVYGRMNLMACGIPLKLLYQTNLWRRAILNHDLTESRIRWRFCDDLISRYLRPLCRNAADQDSFETLRLLALHWICDDFSGDPNTLFFYAFDLTEQVLLNEKATSEGAKRDKLNFLDQLLYKTDNHLHLDQRENASEALKAKACQLDRVYMGMLFAIILHAQNQEILYLSPASNRLKC